MISFDSSGASTLETFTDRNGDGSGGGRIETTEIAGNAAQGAGKRRIESDGCGGEEESAEQSIGEAWPGKRES